MESIFQMRIKKIRKQLEVIIVFTFVKYHRWSPRTYHYFNKGNCGDNKKEINKSKKREKNCDYRQHGATGVQKA